MLKEEREKASARAPLSGVPRKPKPETLDDVYPKSSEDMSDELDDNSVALVVTSPPYNVGKEYDNDLTLDAYLELLRQVFAETKRVLEPGGRVCINIANVGRKPYIPLASHINRMMVEDLDFLMRGEIPWVKADGASGSCAWGSWRSAKNPVLRDIHEYILVFSKDRYDRAKPGKSSIGKEEFMQNSLSVWTMAPEHASRVGHPAPFPEELPRRLIELYTYEDDLVLDPFCGVGTTCVAARKLKRHYVGYDIEQEYVDRAKARLKQTVFGREDFQARSSKEGKKAQEMAESLLEKSGFRIVAKDEKLPRLGLQINFVAEDKKGGRWYFDVTGAFTSERAGLVRTDTMYKCLGRASVMAINDFGPIVLLTTNLPRRNSAGDKALRGTRARIVFDAIEMNDEEQEARLKDYAEGIYDTPLPGFWRPSDLNGS